jgi:hypothetical protein
VLRRKTKAQEFLRKSGKLLSLQPSPISPYQPSTLNRAPLCPMRCKDLLGNENFGTSLDLPCSLQPSSFRLALAASVGEFFEEATELQEQVDALAK